MILKLLISMEFLGVLGVLFLGSWFHTYNEHHDFAQEFLLFLTILGFFFMLLWFVL